MNISSTVVENILSKNNIKRLRSNEAQVVCGFDGGISCGDVITNLERSISRQMLQYRCSGAMVTFGSAVFIIFNVDGDIKVIKGNECDKEFPVKGYIFFPSSSFSNSEKFSISLANIFFLIFSCDLKNKPASLNC